MLLVILHNDRNYLEEVRSVIKAKGLTDILILEERGFAKSFYGVKNNLFFGLSHPDDTNEFNCALVAAVPKEQNLECWSKTIQEALRFYPSDQKTLIFTLPFGSIENMMKQRRKHDGSE